ncbi:MAG TPA: hypothetical protein VEQ85_00670, partial [Lacipirellulaceae bacterium]|nr:hypothetical protein [Lacipirellulaceae bacterium]
RRDLPSERARLVVEQAALRRRGAEKFGELARAMFFTRQHLEQATDLWIGRYKARRLAASGPAADYCCGIGGDLVALAEGGPAAGWDLSPVACLLATANLGGRATIACADVSTLAPEPRGAWHLDPDRRATGRRATHLESYAPGAELIARWLRASPQGCIKLAPATEAPACWAADAELEWISRDRECRQQVVGGAPPSGSAGRRRATVVRGDDAASFLGDAGAPCAVAERPARYLFDPDPALLAAGLLGAFAAANGLASLGPGSAYLTGDQPTLHGLVTSLEVRECLPLRSAEVAGYLAARGVGALEIKKRGVSLDPDAFRRKLRLRGDHAATLILTRVGRREVAIVAERVKA